MKPVYRVAVLGLHHDHVWSHLKDIQHARQTELVGVADPNLPLLKDARDKYGCVTYADYEELLDAQAADIAYVYADNRDGAALATMAAKRGLHVVVEKPMAADLAGAEALCRAQQEQDVTVLVNWPFAWSPALQEARRQVAAGAIGDLWQVKYRAAHEGPRELGCSRYFCDWLYDPKRNGAGALMDYACYGCVLSCVFLGKASAVTAVSGRYLKKDLQAEDNAVVLMRYPNGIGIAEASWTQVGDRTAYVASIYGTQGTLEVAMRADPTAERLWFADRETPAGRPLAIPEPPVEQRTATHHLCAVLGGDTSLDPMLDAKTGRDTQAMLAAALEACAAVGVDVA